MNERERELKCGYHHHVIYLSLFIQLVPPSSFISYPQLPLCNCNCTLDLTGIHPSISKCIVFIQQLVNFIHCIICWVGSMPLFNFKVYRCMTDLEERRYEGRERNK